jgi:Bacterial capsule synthesis protein PGA_cap
MISAGADVVHAHHPHIPQGWEHHAQGWIFYGLGNTLISPVHWAQAERTRRSWSAQINLANLSQAPQILAWECQPARPGYPQVQLEPISPPDRDCLSTHNAPLEDLALLTGLHQEYALHLWDTFYSRHVALGDSPQARTRLTARSLRDAALALFTPTGWQKRRRDRALLHYHFFKMPGHADEIATALGLLGGETPDYRNETTRRLAKEWLPSETPTN